MKFSFKILVANMKFVELILKDEGSGSNSMCI